MGDRADLRNENKRACFSKGDEKYNRRQGKAQGIQNVEIAVIDPIECKKQQNSRKNNSWYKFPQRVWQIALLKRDRKTFQPHKCQKEKAVGVDQETVANKKWRFFWEFSDDQVFGQPANKESGNQPHQANHSGYERQVIFFAWQVIFVEREELINDR